MCLLYFWISIYLFSLFIYFYFLLIFTYNIYFSFHTITASTTNVLLICTKSLKFLQRRSLASLFSIELSLPRRCFLLTVYSFYVVITVTLRWVAVKACWLLGKQAGWLAVWLGRLAVKYGIT